MKKLTLSLSLLFFLVSGGFLFPAEGPLLHVLPAGGSVFVVLADTPREVYGFRVYRKDPGKREYTLLTPEPVVPVNDPYKAQELMGGDYTWISKRVGTEDPAMVWNRLKGDRTLTLVLCLVSHGLRKAAGRTFVDTKGLIKNQNYTYRVELLSRMEKLIAKEEQRVRVAAPAKPSPPTKPKAEGKDAGVTITWNYTPYRGSKTDLTVGFHIYRRTEEERDFTRITPAPVLRVEDGLIYFDERVVNGLRYVYGVSAVDVIGAVSEMILSEPVMPVDTIAPLVPMGLSAADTEEGVLLLWRMSPELDFDHYDVLRSDSVNSEFQKINKNAVEDPKYIDKDIVRGNAYYYKVVAVDGSGNESKPSGAAPIVPKDTTPPKSVSGASAQMNEDKRYVTLTWDPGVEPDIAGYYIYRGREKEKMIRLTAEPYKADEKEPVFVDKGYRERGLGPGEKLFYGISACDASFNEGEIALVEVEVADNVPPHPAFSLSAKSMPDGKVKLIWQPSLSRDLHSHRLYRMKENDKAPRLLKELSKDMTTFVDSEVESGVEYSYFLSEVDESKNESAPSETVTIIPTDTLAPSPPLNLNATLKKTRRGTSVVLEWDKPEDTDVIGYNIYRAQYRGAEWVKLNKELVTVTLYDDRKGFSGAVYGISAFDSSANEGKKGTVVAEQ